MKFGVDIWAAVKATDLIGWVCLILIVILSIRSWSLMFQKRYIFRRMERHNRRFMKYMESVGSLEDMFKGVKKFSFSPLAILFGEAYIEYRKLSPQLKRKPTADSAEAVRQSAQRMIEHSISDELNNMEKGLESLATTANVAPMIGLLGTVWGILGAFQGLAFKGSVAIQTLAPGISTALSTTLFGLLAAVPAAMAYNHFSARSNRAVTEMENFALRVQNVIDQQILRDRQS
jgi:biopolymer transport protein TolQ